MLEHLQLRDGTDAWVIALRRSDRDQLAAEFAALSEETRRQRFLAPVNRLSEVMLDHLVNDVDGVHHIALVLTAETAPGVFDPVAIGRMVRYPDAPDCADLAVTVKDAWQGRGVATALLSVLVRHRPEGVTRILTEVASENDASMAMLSRLGPLRATPNGYGAQDVEVTLWAAQQQAGERGPPPDVDPADPADPDSPAVHFVVPTMSAHPVIDRQHRHLLHTRDLLCPWLD